MSAGKLSGLTIVGQVVGKYFGPIGSAGNGGPMGTAIGSALYPVASRASIVACARTWRDTPWKHQARLKGVGVDCIGFVSEVARECGLLEIANESANYKRRPDGVTLRAKLEQYMDTIPIAEIQPGDVLLFSTRDVPDHVGLVGDYPAAGELSVIHAYVPARKVIEHRLDDSWRRKVVAAFRFRQL